jgi:alpha/beta superfamily hydrolase
MVNLEQNNTKKITIKKSDGTKLSAVLDVPEALRYPLVIICYGFTGYKEEWDDVVPQFIKNNIAVLRFDFLGHGKSEGKFEDVMLTTEIDDLLAVYEYVQKLPRITMVGLFGHSLGGTVALLFSVAKKVDVIVSSAAPLDIKKLMVHFFGDGSESFWKNKGYIKVPWNNKNLNYSFYEDLMKYDMKQILSQVRTPLMVIHGDKDENVSVEEAKEIYNLVRGAKAMKIISGADHNFDSKMPELITSAMFWFSKWLKSSFS